MATSTQPAQTQALAQTQQQQTTITISPFKNLFPLIALEKNLRTHLLSSSQTATSLSGATLVQFLKETYTPSLLSNISPLLPTVSPDATLRSKLYSHPYINLRDQITRVTPTIFKEVMSLADELKVSEEAAMSLYAEASDGERMKDVLGTKREGKSVPELARELFFYERGLVMKSLYHIIRERISGNFANETDAKAVIAGSDAMLTGCLIPKLCTCIRELSVRGQEDRQDYQSLAEKDTFVKENALRVFSLQQRQMAAECLFYLLYNTQAEADEIVAIVELIRDLSNELGESLDPMKDVPSLSHNQIDVMNIGASSASSKSKTEKEWKNELVVNLYSRGKPQLLQCINTLVLTVMSALDPNHLNYSRSNHLPHTFGEGNSLLPPPHTSLPPDSKLSTLHSVLTIPNWKRNDIFSVLSTAYAMLIQPYYNSGKGGLPFDVETTFLTCFESLVLTRSCSFLRTSLLCSIPPSSPFFLSTLAEFVSGYLNGIAAGGDIPISRERWYREEEEELNLRSIHEEQRRQFGLTVRGESSIRKEVDISQRPDCLDDIMALAVEVMVRSGEVSSLFWEVSEENKYRFPKVMKMLDQAKSEDESLLPFFLNYLGGLSLCPEGLECLHQYLSIEEVGQIRINWVYLLNSLRWLADEFSPRDSSEKSSLLSSVGGGSNRDRDVSESYYYNELGGEGDMGSSVARKSSTPILKSPKVLGEANALLLTGMLVLLERIGGQNDSAREFILNIRLPGSGRNDDDEDDILSILFSLLGSSITAKLKGMVFDVISAIIKNKREWALKAWDILENSQVIPTLLLSQYRNDDQYQSLSYNITAHQKYVTSREHYGILYEMEHIEGQSGKYPTTEGFLHLLVTLINTTGCITSLGGDTRRPGVSPYVEYVTSYVLPRITPFILPSPERSNGNKKSESKISDKKRNNGIHFATPADRYRLLTRALAVLAAVVNRYVVPSADMMADGIKDSNNAIVLQNMRTLAAQLNQQAASLGLGSDNPDFGSDLYLVSDNITDEELQSYLYDYSDTSLSLSPNSASYLSFSTSTVTVPCPKSPGFALISEVLTAGPLLEYLMQIVTADGGIEGYKDLNESAAMLGQVQALFSSPPIYPSSSSPTSVISTISMSPSPTHYYHSSYVPHADATPWRSNSLTLTLSILSAIAIRNEPFSALTMARSLTVVPVLRFIHPGPNNYGGIESRTVSGATRLSQLLVACPAGNKEEEPLAAVASGVVADQALGRLCLGLVSYVVATVPKETALPALCGRKGDGGRVLAYQFAQRMQKVGGEVVIDVVLQNLSSKGVSLGGIVMAAPGWNGTNALLDIISLPGFLGDRPAMAAKAYELLYKLYVTGPTLQKTLVTKLPHLFWYHQIKYYLPSPTQSHAYAWLMKALAEEIHRVKRSHPQACAELLHQLFTDAICRMEAALITLPLFYPNVIPAPPSVNQQVIRQATQPLEGPKEITARYMTVNELYLAKENELVKCWGRQWNDYVKWACEAHHVCAAWERLLGALTSSYAFLQVVTGNALNKLFIALLTITAKTAEHKEIEAGSATHLANALLRALPCLPSDQDTNGLCQLTVDCIAHNANKGEHHNEHTAVLSCALSQLLARQQYKLAATAQSHNSYLYAAAHLVKLASTNDTRANPKTFTITLAVRAGLKALITTFDSSSNNSRDSLSLRLFANKEGATRLAVLVHLLPAQDTSIAETLQCIALTHHGAEMLHAAGVSAVLPLSKKDHQQDIDDRETYGAMERLPPNYILSHIKLLITMVDSHPPQCQSLMADVGRFLSHYATLAERLLRSFPKYRQISEAYLTLLALVVAEPGEIPLSDEVFPVVQRVKDFVLHVAMHPLPIKMMPPLPYNLIEIERNSNSRKAVTVTTKCWWDSVTDDISHDEIMSSTYGPVEQWNIDVLKRSLEAVKCLELGLRVLEKLCRRAQTTATIGIFDVIMLAKGICRCADITQTIGNHLKSSPNGAAGKDVEAKRETLLKYGKTLAQCTELLLVLSTLQTRSLRQEKDSTSGRNNYNAISKMLQESKLVFDATLKHVNIENFGIGCVSGSDAEFGKKMARCLRDQIEGTNYPVAIGN